MNLNNCPQFPCHPRTKKIPIRTKKIKRTFKPYLPKRTNPNEDSEKIFKPSDKLLMI
jgi:hypothetical protein